ncbi:MULTISPECIES: hypothetical protein [unclassified Psychrobacter]|uniref:hypothetical protein n=1 Tax=unclassified Psychrobacter TaxID=196806 RepID=UPI003F489263
MTQGDNNYHQDISQPDIFNKTLDTDDSWIKKIWARADEFGLKEFEVPRDKESLLAITKLDILEPERDEQRSRDLYRIGYMPDELANLTSLVEINISGISSSHLPQNIGQLSNLTKLSISHSKLIVLGSLLTQLSSILIIPSLKSYLPASGNSRI